MTAATAVPVVTPVPNVTRYAFGVTVEYRDPQGQYYRLDGPAHVYTTPGDATLHWSRNHRLHRFDGPSIIWSGGRLTWKAPGFAGPTRIAIVEQLDQP